MRHRNITGALICGGTSKRFGSDKRLYRYKGKTFFDIAYEKLTAVCEEVVCVFRNEVPAPLDRYPLIYDDMRFEGPIAGILAALNHTEHAAVLTLPCDVPLITVNFLNYLASFKNEGKVIVPYVNGLEPLIALYPKTIEPRMRAFAERDASLHRFIESLGFEEKNAMQPSQWAAYGLTKDHFSNVNFRLSPPPV